ncbi:MAG: Glutamate synthase [NADPH] large chain (EC [uncultured Thiotrichaceae bacterium]|uniref:Glutamate synthase [NADPH] large chain (EC) n=1 Tax=uncultured Thiotrichaceae bacterium TaxID=298394 RepID=A0A6S6SBC7_9GAMM|nr:MAG: Glutamate synthase [NADPH] large chain (EC [uncultured Thiotrichaceae bacterium]
MNNNDILRRLRFTFDFDDAQMMALSSTKDQSVSRAEISNWLRKEDDEGYQSMNDHRLAIFLNNLIDEKRGKREGVEFPHEKNLNNNQIFMKLKIALNLKAEDILDVLALADFTLSKHELSAFFRKEGHKHYRQCKDQVLRNLLQGLQQKYRPDSTPIKTTFQWAKIEKSEDN